MRIKRIRTAVGALACALAAWSSTVMADEALDSVIGCMRANIPNTVQIKEVELISTDRVGATRTLRGRLYGTREDDRLRAMMKIGSPADLAGAAYLMREKAEGDEMYVYVPALQKVRRITGAGVDGALWGTDISYGDVRQLNNAFTSGRSVLEGGGELGGRKVHHLAVTPDPAEASRFSMVKVWVDQQSCVSLRADFMEGGLVGKRLEIDPASLRQSGTHWYAGEALMTDLKEGTQTRLKVLGLSSDVNLSGRYFNPSTFYLGS
ncbi:outer membrane lipoprotein-sorting protein [Sinimarinibacterium sp. CAU 1509]|uniref:outer membrane lipoprotein-sorting protein n=1 Tax=Sinimarinibacterium sp. CAU 1509 TaxID=2562283 RepID=UPI00146AC727|nr:outer membrane lipoprotein-sorting protein [Sinimarinibacterium sp. CAU 1509]